MEYFLVEGGQRLQGTITPQGAKNEALQVVCAPLLTDKPVILNNVPDILDVRRLLELLAVLGANVQQTAPDQWQICAAGVDPARMYEPRALKLARAIRGSIMLAGPMLARHGKAIIPKPGGDKIGRRRLDTHLIGLQALGAEFTYRSDVECYELTAPAGGLKGAYMLLDEASVTGTANILMAAVCAHGTTTIYNAACEPYVQQLCRLLTHMGAQIEGQGSNLLTITGRPSLGGTTHRLLADMIEVGSFIAMAAMTQGHLRIAQAGVAHLGIIPEMFHRMGVTLNVEDDDLVVPAQEVCEIDTFLDGSILTIQDHTWPGLTPDLLSVFLVLATQCRGTVLIHQKMFESRLFFVDKLLDMGAQVILCDPHRATVIGLARQQALRGISMTSPDIRAGVALLMAALSAQGTSKIFNIEQIDRGYQHIDQRLRQLGARIERKTE